MYKGLVLMIIDDDQEDLEIFQEVVSSIDPAITLLQSFDPEEALVKLDIAGSNLPDIIFLDLNMPRMNGMECLQIIKQMEKVKEVPVIMHSTSSSIRDIERSKELGATSFITKPSTPSELKSKLLEIFGTVLIGRNN